jgi:sodium-dependent phosphate transporter
MFSVDLEKQSFHESQRAKECWDNMTQYDEDVEQLFTFVQVFTASMNAFAHGEFLLFLKVFTCF